VNAQVSSAASITDATDRSPSSMPAGSALRSLSDTFPMLLIQFRKQSAEKVQDSSADTPAPLDVNWL
jgi:hypothetical protein